MADFQLHVPTAAASHPFHPGGLGDSGMFHGKNKTPSPVPCEQRTFSSIN